jgi:hypothetical protein
MFPIKFYKRRCYFIGHSKCLVNGNYFQCKMMTHKGKINEIDMFYVSDDRPIYDEQECKFFKWTGR